MNRIFRLVWNEALGTWVAVSEIARGRSKRSVRAAALIAPVALVFGLLPPAHAGPAGTVPGATQLPTGGQVSAGSARIETNAAAATVDIQQSSARAAINWNTFDVGSAAQVNFHQPDGRSATLNRVLDSNPSQILGKITANGQVILSNPNGVYFGKSATVDVGGLTATTHGISDADFMAGKNTFTRGHATGSVVNEGQLRAALGGYIALLAPEVRNEGVIIARMGTVAMASGEAITLNFDGNHSLANLTVQPSAVKALVDNRGAVYAPGGLIVLSARALDRLQGGVVHNTGRLEATGLSVKGGRIVLEASGQVDNAGTISADAGADGSPAGQVTVSAPAIVNTGTITAAAPAPAPAAEPADAGSITLTADTITQSASGKLDASGPRGGRITLQATHDIALQGQVVAKAQAPAPAPVTAPAPAPAPASAAVAPAADPVPEPSVSGQGEGGRIELLAGHDVTLQDAVLDVSGDLQGGQIRVQGGQRTPAPAPVPLDRAPTVALLGSSDLRGSSRRGQGGSIVLSAERVGLFDQARLDASGATGGGELRVGGGFHGQDAEVANAQQTVLAAGASLDASATESGAGGQVAVWSDGRTGYAGRIDARGAQGGAGGFVEVSGKGALEFTGQVQAGTLLLDPKNITIDDSAAASTTDLATLDQFSDNPSGDSTIASSTITAVANAGTAVVLQANNDITVNSSIVTNNASGNGGNLSFSAGRSIVLNASVISDGGNISFTVNDAGADPLNRDAGTAVFNNNGLIDARAGNVSITMGTGGASGAIDAGEVTAGNYTIAHNATTATSGDIDLGGTSVSGNLSISSAVARNLTNAAGTVSVAGTSTIDVGSGDVTFDRASTDFNIIGLTAGQVTIHDATALQLATSHLSGNLALTTVGPIRQTGAVVVAGTTDITAGNGGFGYADPYIDLSNAGNDFQGAVTLSVPSNGSTGTGGYISLRDANDLDIASASASRWLTLQAAGTVTASTLRTQGGDLNLTSSAAGSIALGSTTVAGNASITGKGDLTLGTTSVSNTLAVNTSGGAAGVGAVSLGDTTASTLDVSSGGAITDTGTQTISAYTKLTAGAGNDITLDSAANNFNRIWVASGRNVSVVDSNAIVFGYGDGTATSNIAGTLDVSAGGSISAYRNNENYAPMVVAGAATFTTSGADSDLMLGANPATYTGNNGYKGANNAFASSVTLATTGGGSWRDVFLRNTDAGAGPVSGLGSSLRDVFFYFDNAPSLQLPAMGLTGNLVAFAPKGSITQTGPIVDAGTALFGTSSTQDITLDDAGNDFNHLTIQTARDAVVVDSNALDLYAAQSYFNVTRDLTVTAGGAITDSSIGNNFGYYMNVGSGGSGTATFTAGSANDITLDNDQNYWQTVSIVSANNLVLNPRLGVTLGNVNAAGTLSMNARNTGSSLAQLASTSVHAGGTTSFTDFGGGINLSETGNVLGDLAIANAGDLYIRENDAITQAAAWSMNGTNGGTNSTRRAVTLATSDEQAITLDQAGNAFGNLTITQYNSGASSAGAVLVRETGDSWFGLTQGGAWTTHGATTVDAGAYSIRLDNADNVLGPLQVLGGAGLTAGAASTVTIYAMASGAGDAISDVGAAGPWRAGTGAGASVRLVGYASDGTTAGGGNITLANTGNVLGDVYVKANDLTLTEADSVTDGTATIWNGAGDTGWVTNGATRLVVADPEGRSIALDNLSNVLGPVSLDTTGTAGTLASVLVTDNSDLTQSGAWKVGGAPVTLDARTHRIDLSASGNVLGNVSINTSNGTPAAVTLWEDDAITEGSAWSLANVPITLVAQNDKAITLANAANVMGALTLTGGAVSIAENDSITQGGAWTTTGATTLNAGAIAITLTNAGNVLGDLAFGGAPGAVNIRENDDITQAAAWALPSTPITLDAGGHDLLLTQAANQLGVLSLTAANASVTESDAAGITDGAGWQVSGLTTLNAGSANPIVLNAAGGDFGSVRIVSAGNAEITDANGIVFDTSTVASGGVLTVTAGGAIAQTGAITASALRLLGSGYATLDSAGNAVGTLAAGFSGGSLRFTNAGNLALGAIGGTTGATIGAHDVRLRSVAGTVTGLNTVNASSTSLTVDTGAGLSLPQMSVAGPQSYTAGGTGITLTAGVTSTAAGAISFHSPVMLAADVSLQSANSDLAFDSTVGGAGNQLIVNTGSGQVSFLGAVSGLGSTGDAGSALQLTSGGAVFDSTLAASNGLAITGPVVFKDDVTLADGNAGSVFTGLVTLGKAGGMNLSGYDGMTFNGGVLLQLGPAAIVSNNAALGFQTAGTVSGPFGLTLDAGTQTISGLDRLGNDLTSLSVTALNPTVPGGGVTIAGAQSYTATAGSSITLDGNVTSTAAGAIRFNSPVVVAAAATVTSADSAITFADRVDGNNNLTVNAATANVSFGGDLGSITALGSGNGAALTLQGSGASHFAGAVQARSGIAAAGAVDFARDVTLGNGDTGSAFSARVTADGIAFTGYDGIAFDGGLSVTGGALGVASNGSTIRFGAAVNGDQALTLDTLAGGAGTVAGLDRIGTASGLSALSITGQTVSLPASGLAVAGPMEFSAAGGITLNGAVGDAATGTIDFRGPVSLATGAIAVTTGNAAISFHGTLDGAQSLSVNAGTAATTFSAAVGGGSALASLSASGGGSVAMNGGSIRTSGDQNYADPVLLGADTTLTGANVHFHASVDGAHALTVNASGATTFDGAVGAGTALASLATDAPGSTVLNDGRVTTSGAQAWGDAVALGADATLAGTGIHFQGTLDGAHALSADAGSGALQFQDSAGGTTALASVDVRGNTLTVGPLTSSGAQAYTAPGGITLAGGLASDAGDISFTGPVTLAGDATVTTGTGLGNIAFNGPTSTINGAHALTLAAGSGNVVLGGVVGGITPLAAMTVSGNDLTLPGIHTAGDANQSYTALDDITLNQSRTLNAPIAFVADADGDGQGSLVLLDGVSLTASNNALSIQAADLDLQGSSTLSSGSGQMTLTASPGVNIALGGSAAPGQMTISGDELARMTSSGGLALRTTGAGWVHVDGISGAQSQNITGVLSLQAQGTGDIAFLGAASTFNALSAHANGGLIQLGVDLNTSNDPLSFETAVAVAGASTLNSGGGNIAFQDALDVDNDLTLTTVNGALSFAGAVGSNKTLTLNLGGGSVSGLGQLQSTLTGLTVNSSSAITLPAFTISGPQVYNTGVITVTGGLGGQGIGFNNVVDVVPASGSAVTLDAGAGTLRFANLASFNANDLTLVADEIDFVKSVSGSGALSLRPASAGRDMVVGGAGGASGLNLTAAELAWLPLATLASLTLGDAAGSGALQLAGAIAFAGHPLTLNGGGGITQTGGTVAAGDLTLSAAGNAITLASSGNAFGPVAVNGMPSALTLTNTQAITQSGAWALGASPVTLDAGTHDITLDQAGNRFGTLQLTGHTVQVREADATDLGASTADSLAVVSDGAITTSGALAVTGLADFRTLDDAGAGITIASGSQFASVRAAARNAADTADAAGDIVLAPAASTLLDQLTTAGDITLTAAGGQTLSQNPGSVLRARGLELLGAGSHELAAGSNEVSTLAGNTGSVRWRDDSGFDVGTVHTAGLATSGDLVLSSAGAVTQSQALAAQGLGLLGGGSYALDDGGNAVVTLAGATGSLRFTDNGGFTIGSVAGTDGLAASGELAITSSGSVTQSQRVAASGLALLGGGSYTLDDSRNEVSTLAGATGSLRFTDNSGFAIASVAGTDGLAASGDIALTSAGGVTQSQDLSAAGLALLGTGGSFVLTRGSNSVAVLAGNTGSAALHTAGALAIGSAGGVDGMTTAGTLALKAGGTISQTQALVVAGALQLETTQAAGDVAIANAGAASTRLGQTSVGGDYTVTATGQAVTQEAGTDIQVAGNLAIDGASLAMGGAGNLVGGTTTTPSVAELRQSGVITLGNIDEAGNYSVVSLASNKSFSGPAVHGSAIDLGNAANSIGGAISVRTAGPAVTTGADVQTGIQQQAGTAIHIGGVASFTVENSSVAGSGLITLDNTGNSFGSLVLSGKDVSVSQSSGNLVLQSALASGGLSLDSAGTVTQTGAIVTPQLAVNAAGAITLQDAGNAVSTFAARTQGGAIAYSDQDGFDIGAAGSVNGIDTGTGASVSLTAGGSGSITQTQSIHASRLSASAGGALALNDTGNTLGTLGALNAGTGIDLNDSTGGLAIDGNLASAAGGIQVHTEGGDLSLADTRTVTAGGSGNVVLAAGLGYNFRNDWADTAANPLSVGTGRYLIYSRNNTTTTLGGITANGYMGYTYALNAPGTIAGSDNRVLYQDAATLLFTADNLSRSYGDANPVLTYTVSGYLSGDDASVWSGAPVLGTLATQGSHVGSYTISVAAGTLSSSKGYVFNFAPGTLTVNPRAVNLTGSRAYDGSTAVDAGIFSVGNTYNGETLALTGAGTILDANVGAGKLVNTGVLALADGTGLAGDYTLVGGTHTMDVTPRTVSLSASKVYDGTLALDGAVAIDTGVAGETLGYAGALASDANVATAGKFIGAITLADGSGLASNYQLPTLDASHAPVAITPRTVSLSASKTYDGTTGLDGQVSIATGIAGEALGYGGAIASDAHVATAGKYISAITLADGAGGLASNYQLPSLAAAGADNAVAITPATLTATLANTGVGKVYDGTTDVGSFVPAWTFTGLASGDSGASLASTGMAYDSAHVADASRITVSGLSISGVTGANSSLSSDYALDATSKSVAARVTPRTLTATVTNTGVSKTYDGSTAAPVGFTPSFGLSGFAAGDTGATVDTSAAAMAYDLAHVATASRITLSGLAVGGVTGSLGSVASDYALDGSVKTVAASITPATLTATLANTGVSKVYDGTADAGSFTPSWNFAGLVGGDSGASLASTGIAYDSAHVATASQVTVSGLSIAGVTGSNGSLASDYVLGASSQSVAAAITPRTLTATLANTGVSKVYDGTTGVGSFAPDWNFSGLAGGDSGASLASTGMAYDSAHVATASQVTVSGLSISGITGPNGSLAGDYMLDATSQSVAAAITPRTVSLSASKVYDGSLSLDGAVTLGTGLAGDTLGYTGAVASDANVATAGKFISAITLSDGAGGLASDYQLPTLDAAHAPVTITPRTVSLSASKVYDGTLSLDGAVTLATGVAGETLGYSGATASDANVATAGKSISAITLADGTGLASNYQLPTLDAVNAPVSITPYVVSLSGSRAYDGSSTVDAGIFGLGTLVGGQTLGLTGSGSITDPHAGSGKTVGLGTLALADGTGLASNYTLAGGTHRVDIGRALLTVSADVASRTYDGSTVATLNGLSVSGLVAGEAVRAVSTGTASFADRNAGSGKAVTVTGIQLVDGTSDGMASDYTVASTATTTADIAKADLSVAGVTALDKVYDGTTSAQISTAGVVLAGRIGSDDVRVGSITGRFADKNVGSDKAVTGSAFVLSGADAGNYNLIQPTGLTASITPRALTVTATGVDKVYDGTLGASVALADDRIAGDDLGFDYSAQFLDKNVGVNKFVGVTGITLSGADAGNYRVGGSAAAFASISRATLLVSATGASRTYDGSTDASVSLADNRVAGDALDLAYTSAAFADKNAGTGKTIRIDGITLTGTDAGNYQVSSTATASADIARATLSVTASAADKNYDGTTAATVTLADDRLAADQLTLAHGAASFEDALPGTDKRVDVSGIAIAGGADAGNYVLAATTATARADILALHDSWMLPWQAPQGMPAPAGGLAVSAQTAQSLSLRALLSAPAWLAPQGGWLAAPVRRGRWPQRFDVAAASAPADGADARERDR